MLSNLLPDYRVRQRDYLLEIARALAQELNLDSLLSRILKIAVEMLAGQAGLITLRAEEGGWKVVVSQGVHASFIRAAESYLARVPEDEDPAQFELPEIHRLFNELSKAASKGLLNGFGLPLTARGRVVGIILIFRSYEGMLSANDYAILDSFAGQAAVAVQNVQFFNQSNRERARMNNLLDSMADGVLILSPANLIARSNPSLGNMLGMEVSDIVGKAHEEVIRWQKPPKEQTLEQAQMGGWPLSEHAHLYVEGDLQRKSMAPLAVGITYAPLLSEEGRLINIISTVRDISSFREADAVKSTFISIISHELKTPVALIKGYVSTLRRDDVRWDSEIVQDSLKVIEEESDRLAGMIENLLDASRLQAGGMVIQRTDLSLPDLAGRVAQRMRSQSSHHKIEVRFPDFFPVILADENRIQQVLTNLVGNAIKYSAGGTVTIGGDVRADTVVLYVADEGPGIKPDEIPHVFDRFYRGSDMSKVTKGAGLGLYLTKQIIEAHGGQIWVDTQPGHGTRIYFSLPRS